MSEEFLGSTIQGTVSLQPFPYQVPHTAMQKTSNREHYFCWLSHLVLNSPPVIKAKLNTLKTKLFHDLWAKAIFWRCSRLQNIILHVIYFIVACYCSLKRQKGEGNPQTTTISLNSDIINTVKYVGSVCSSGASSHVTLNILKRLSDLSSDLVAFRRVSTAGTPPPPQQPFTGPFMGPPSVTTIKCTRIYMNFF